MIEKKKESIGSKLLIKCPQEMYMVYDHIRHLEFDSKPNYAMLRRQLDRVSVTSSSSLEENVTTGSTSLNSLVGLRALES